MKTIATLIASFFVVSAFAGEPAKPATATAPVATPAVTKADAKHDKSKDTKKADKKAEATKK